VDLGIGGVAAGVCYGLYQLVSSDSEGEIEHSPRNVASFMYSH
jgi:hypothetical protein